MCFNIISGIPLLFMGFHIPSKAIKEIWLLRGGEMVRIVTYSPMNLMGNLFRRIVDAPVTEVGVVRTLKECQEKNLPMTLKVKGMKRDFQMDVQKGIFHEPRIFEYVIGLKRNFK